METKSEVAKCRAGIQEFSRGLSDLMRDLEKGDFQSAFLALAEANASWCDVHEALYCALQRVL